MSFSAAPTESFDLIVVGGGHAGCEAAITAARLGLNTALFTLNLDRIAWQPCNPAVGGPAKSYLKVLVESFRYIEKSTIFYIWFLKFRRFLQAFLNNLKVTIVKLVLVILLLDY